MADVFLFTVGLVARADIVFSQPVIELAKLLFNFLSKLRLKSLDEVIFEEIAIVKPPEKKYLQSPKKGFLTHALPGFPTRL